MLVKRTMREVWTEELIRPCVKKYEAIQQGNAQLHELERNKVLLRTKNMILDVKIKQLEKELKEEFLNEKLGKLQLDRCKPKDELEYDRKVIG